ncbi:MULTISPECIES: pitrilysin family protein [unclassified Lysobacter]|uniref:M16 family metallopeptidase n=1 Tax=unclassified Lysobacter TaxID=2635362 RepID=UPI001BEA6CC3|nr:MULTISPECIES: pitrilysin family protein [unclassified Lysobacter]MBT2747006.1 insulinase family protein [Lysobacter sp. ISL-42]MBT2750533.1 insulinase family protein [Lysobacter sp. ISL-50]MBT2776379.1 insulinase family protein [Lysobacter sp. ISL-54]MBT2780874.1 insulinase family protein [Lysobacter sp. ISL-52]
MRKRHLSVLLAGLTTITTAAFATASAAESDRWQVPVAVKKLDNGLTVVVSPDHTSPTVGISVVYHVGMRLEPKNRTGFAHLFEHLMFQGTPVAPKGVFDKVISGGGGRNNGSTRPDFTNYIEIAPVSALDRLLWLEADRMKTLDFNPTTLKNQQDVVKEEIRVNVKNQPYGGFMWIDIGQHAFQKWENNHDGYGSFQDLENASLADVQSFHRDYYGPNNAVLGIAGDISPAEAFALADKYFGAVPGRPTPAAPDYSEGLNTAEKRIDQTDALAQVPAIAAAWKMPARGSRDHAPMAVLGNVLAGDDASRLYQGLVKQRQIALNVEPLYGLVDPWTYNGPTLYTLFALYKPDTNADAVLAAIDEEVAKIARDGVDAATLKRVKTKMLADWYNGLESFIERANTIALMQTLWGDANVVNKIPGLIEGVTSADLQRVAKTYLTRANRTVIDRRPAAMAAAAPAAKADAAPSQTAAPSGKN